VNLFALYICATTYFTKVVNTGSLHWDLALFIYFRSKSGLSRSCCRWPESKTIVRAQGDLWN